jgi:phospholipid/cholesterol/gamma-HCH transport system substrate-binding protein
MPQRKEAITWGQLRVGLMVGIGLIILVVGILLISRGLGALGSHYTLKAYFPEAEGLRNGAEVDLAGVPVGDVDQVYVSNLRDPNRAVIVLMTLRRDYQDDIRADSVATIQTAGLLGQSFVDISRGSPTQPILPNGAEVTAREGPDIKQVVNNANDVLSNLTMLSSKLNDITNQITAGKGSIGQFIYDPALYKQTTNTVADAQKILARISKGQGTVGQLVASDELAKKLNSTLDRLNGMMDQMQHGHGSLAKFINDPSFYDNLNKDLTQARSLMAGIEHGNGTLGRMYEDPQLYNRLNSVAGNLNTITQRMAQGKGSLGLLSTDTKFYDNLSQSMQSLRDFLTEFRKDPRKYLTVHIKIF